MYLTTIGSFYTNPPSKAEKLFDYGTIIIVFFVLIYLIISLFEKDGKEKKEQRKLFIFGLNKN